MSWTLRFSPCLVIACLAACSLSPAPQPPPSQSGGSNQPVETVGKQSDAEPATKEVTTAKEVTEPAADAELANNLQAKTLTPEELADGWISLFDGQTLFGWEAATKANWHVADGTIVVSEGEKGLLCTTTQFSDYILRADFQCDAATNSGIFLRTPRIPTDPASDCYELNIAPPDNPFPTGSFVKRKKVDGVYDSREWQTLEATCDGPAFTVKIGDKTVLEYTETESRPTRGHIGLQLNSGRVAFRNIRLKPLGTKSLFNGQDLSGWKEYPEFTTRFTVADGVLHAKNGPGQLESAGQFGDFVLQLECQTHGEGLNSGVFFRCNPGEKMNGYECQINNAFNGVRTKPKDCGTGGIFRRQNARFVVANDNEWFHLTLAADGPHMAAWVNGFQVSDWTDDRKPDANPRKGKRVEPGTLMLQGHDPTTDLSFRNLRAVEIR